MDIKLQKKVANKPVNLLLENKGFALIVVMVVMLLVSFLASQLILKVRTESKIVFNTSMRTAAAFLAEAGVNLALFRLQDTPVEYLGEEYEKFMQGYMYEATLPNGKVEYLVAGESGKINLNSAPRRLLELFFEHHGLEPEEIATVLDSLEDWKDSDDFHKINGAEKKQYEELEIPYIPRNGNIEDPAEFFLIYGTTPLIGKFDAEEIFTVQNTNSRTIDYNKATPAILDFLTGGDEEKKAAYIESRAAYGDLNDATARQVFGDERYDLLSPYLTNRSSLQDPYLTIIATGKVTDKDDAETEDKKLPACRVDALVKKEGAGYKILSWKEQYI